MLVSYTTQKLSSSQQSSSSLQKSNSSPKPCNQPVKNHCLSDGRYYTGLVDCNGKATDVVGKIFCVAHSQKYKEQQPKTIYEGQVVDGIPNGPGRLLNRFNIVLKEGIWKDWELITPTFNANHSPQFPQKVETGFSSAREKFNPFEDHVVNSVTASNYLYPNGDMYSGSIFNGKRHGYGTMRYADGHVYEGWWKDNLKSGPGTLRVSDAPNGVIVFKGNFDDDKFEGEILYPDQSHYKGEALDLVKHGRGKYVNKNGTVYEGNWVDNNFDGEGTLTFASGDQYEGEFKEGQKHGKGIYKFKNGDEYRGDFANDMKHGQGIYRCSSKTNSGYIGFKGHFVEDQFTGNEQKIIYTDQSKYAGQTERGIRQGFGTCKYKDDCEYAGEWADNLYDGLGILDLKTKDKVSHHFDGHWKKGKMSGRGVYSVRDEKKNETIVYIGEFEDNKFNGDVFYPDKSRYTGTLVDWHKEGTGTVVYHNGDKYEGEWKNDKFNGKGIYTWKCGDQYEGEHLSGLRHGKGIYKFINSLTKVVTYFKGEFDKDNFVNGVAQIMPKAKQISNEPPVGPHTSRDAG